MKNLLLITHSQAARQAIPRFAESAIVEGYDLLIASCTLNPVSVPGKVDAWPILERPQRVRKAIQVTIEQLSNDNVTLLDGINSGFPNQEVANIVRQHDINMVYFPIDARLNPGAPDMQFGQWLLRNLACDVFLVDLGKNEKKLIKQIVIPIDLAESGHALNRLMRLRSRAANLVPIHISQDFGGDSQKIAAMELELQLKEIGIEENSSSISPRVVMADGFYQGILQTVRANDAIILSGVSIKQIHDLKMHLIGIRPQIAETIMIGIFRAADFAARTRFGRFGRRLKAALPELTLADRVSLFDRIQGGARITPDFLAMMGLSVLIASLGLLSDNPSVVIGAMLVAPFMTPLIGVGLALSQGNLALMKRSAIATGTGLILGVCLSLLLGLLVPLDELPLEVLARGDPNLIDLGIAFVSGMAAAYAVSRVSVAESIVGVAIAAALVPPLSCIGIMLGHGYTLETEGAIILLLTNLAAIVLGAAFVFRRLGVPGTRTGLRSYVKIRWISITLILLLLALIIPLGRRMADQLVIGQTRPMSFRASSRVKHAVYDRINEQEGVSVMFLGRSGSGQSRLIRILLNTEKPLPADVIADIKADIRETLGEDTPIDIGVFQNAVISETKTPADD